MQYAPIRVHEKFVRSHISLHGYAKNAPGFRCKPSARDISGRMQYAPTRVHEKPGGFHISVSGHAKNLPDFTFPNKDSPKNAPDFTLPNRDTPKTYPILDPKPCRRTFRGVCFCALHGYVQNLTGFIFPHPNMSKTHPILHLNHRRRTFRGVCNTPLHGYAQNLPDFRPKPSSQDIWGRMQYAPTRVHEKFDGFHIPAHDMVRNPAGFIFPHTTWHETRRVLDFATRHGAKPGGFWTLPHNIA